ncbi:FAD/NAD(P)-binding domain-containing protein [Mycena crocata]|nr:FAD/NAD(P)-binding domain-containing protein [Mycena crocata]
MSVEAVSKDYPTQSSGVPGDAAPGQLDIAIIGAGLVGLATAAMLRRQGHRITIFESSSFHAEIGAGITLTPNGVASLKNLLPNLNWANMQPVDLRSVEMFNSDGTHTNTVDLSGAWKDFPQGWFMMHRVDIHKELMRLVLDPDADSFPPVAIRLGTPIKTVDFDAKRPSVTSTSGEDLKYDLILGADGIKSTVRKCMVGAEYDAPAGRMSFYRWIVDLDKHPALSWIRDDRNSSGPTNVTGKDIWIFGYPVRGGRFINISAAHFDKRDPDTVGMYRPPSVQMHLIDGRLERGRTDGHFPGGFRRLWREAHAIGLRRLPILPTWIKGNVALLGDAAHAMNPTYGQGYAMGLEDAATIATLFPSGTKTSEIPARVKAYEEIRKPRAEHVSQLSFDGLKLDLATLFGSYWIVPDLLGYDPVSVAKAALSRI